VAGDLHGRPGKETLHFPLPVPARLAVIDADFHIGVNMRAFHNPDLTGIIEYAPDAMALPLSAALALADRKLRGLFQLPSLELAIVVFSTMDYPDHGLLDSHHRDLLWKAFCLPVFEQLRGRDGKVIARECEIHDGMHFEPEAFEAQTGVGFPAEIVEGYCDCGFETPRLRRLSGAGIRSAVANAKTRAAAA
jgi:hypothetical protein